MLDQVMVWGGALKFIRPRRTASRHLRHSRAGVADVERPEHDQFAEELFLASPSVFPRAFTAGGERDVYVWSARQPAASLDGT